MFKKVQIFRILLISFEGFFDLFYSVNRYYIFWNRNKGWDTVLFLGPWGERTNEEFEFEISNTF